MLKCAIIGLGGLGKLHFKNISQMNDVEITALCDVEQSAFHTKTDTNLGRDGSRIDISKYALYRSHTELLANETLDFVVVAVPTFLHARIAIDALSAGVSVMCEKPMARTVEESEAMLAAAEANGRRLMIGQCMRFYPEYLYLHDKVKSGELGRVLRADFTRLSRTPKWGWENWYMDYERSGGAALDLHIHDSDAIYWLFGAPDAVLARTASTVAKYDSIHTIYEYPDKEVTALANWSYTDSFVFRMGFIVRFERAVVELNQSGLFVSTDRETVKIELPRQDAYYNELREFITCLLEKRESKINPAADSAHSLKLAHAEVRSAESAAKEFYHKEMVR